MDSPSPRRVVATAPLQRRLSAVRELLRQLSLPKSASGRRSHLLDTMPAWTRGVIPNRYPSHEFNQYPKRLNELTCERLGALRPDSILPIKVTKTTSQGEAIGRSGIAG